MRLRAGGHEGVPHASKIGSTESIQKDKGAFSSCALISIASIFLIGNVVLLTAIGYGGWSDWQIVG